MSLSGQPVSPPGEQRKGPPHPWVNLALAIVLLTGSFCARFLASIIHADPPTDPVPWLFEIVRVFIALAGGYFMWRYVQWRATARPMTKYTSVEPESTKPSASVLADNFVAHVLDQPLDRMTSGEAWTFAQQFVQPSLSRGRVKETITVARGRTRRDCSVQFKPALDVNLGPDGKSKREFIPLARFKRGRVLTDLRIEDHDGFRLASLPHDEFMTLVGVCVRKLLRDCVDSTEMEQSLESQVQYIFVENALIGLCVLHRPLQDRESLEERAKLILGQVLNGLQGDSGLNVDRGLDIDKDKAELLCALVAQVQAVYGIVVRVSRPPEYSKTITYSYTEALFVNETLEDPRAGSGSSKSIDRKLELRRRWRKIQNLMRQGLEVSLPEMRVDASRSRSSESYHLEVEAPPDYYVAEAWFYNDDDGVKTSIHRGTSPGMYEWGRPHSRVTPACGETTTHVYTRSFKNSDHLHPWLYVRFVERPPGSLGRALLVSAGLLITVWLIGVAVSTSAGGQLRSDLGAMVFAIPIGLIAVFGFTSKERGYTGTLVSQGAIVGSILLAVVVLVALQLTEAKRLDSLPKWPSLLMVENPVWILLLLASLALTIGVAAVLGVRWLRWQWAADGPRRPGELSEPSSAKVA